AKSTSASAVSKYHEPRSGWSGPHFISFSAVSESNSRTRSSRYAESATSQWCATAAPIRTPDPPLRNPTHAPASLSVRGRSQGCTSVVPPSESSSAPVLPTPEDDPSSGSGGAEVVASEELSSVDASVSDAS